MKMTARTLLGLVLCTLAAPALAGLADTPLPAGAIYLYSVLGVINTGSLGTYLDCTSTSTGPQTVTVEAFDEAGTASGSGSLIVVAGTTVRFGTQAAFGLTVDSLLGSGVGDVPAPVELTG